MLKLVKAVNCLVLLVQNKLRRFKNQHDIKIDKRKMDLPHGIHALGYTNVPVKLDKEVEGTIRVHTVEK